MVEPHPRERIIKLPALSLSALEWKLGQHPILALHGWLDNAATFTRLAPRLNGMHVIALDLPGHGTSDWLPAGTFYHFIDAVSYVVEVVDALGWDRFSLMGHSMGSGIATLVAGTVPDRVNRLVLIEGIGPLVSEPGSDAQRLTRSLMSEHGIRSSKPRSFSDLTAATAARCRGTELDPQSAHSLVSRGTRNEGSGVVFCHDPGLKVASRLRMTESQVSSFLQTIQSPVMAVRANDGWPFPEEILQSRCEQIANLERIDVPGGHHVHLTHPERISDSINRFLGG
ncbi:MAG: alpha/beta hydrolase [bacterium]|nr:alpha/beta hydrolase [bacterium]